jgi:long-chain acyl-CoA synthetase
MIICGCVNLAPNEIENVIIKNPKVAETAVARAPDEDLEEVPLVIVQLKKGKEMTGDELEDWCKKEGLYGFKIPKIVEFREVPAAYGKVRKMEIEEEYWEKKGIKRRG